MSVPNMIQCLHKPEEKNELLKRRQCLTFSQWLADCCVWEYSQKTSICMHHQQNISSQFSRNSEANASEFLENSEEMFPHYL